MQELLVKVSIKNILHNVAVWKGRLNGKSKFYAVVKANAYGHGAERVAEEIESVVDGFAVATVEEGLSLRLSGVQKEIMLLCPALSEEEAVLAARHSLTLCFCSLSAYFVAKRGCEKYRLPFKGQIKADTGMNRLGVRGGTLTRLCKLLSEDRLACVTGIYSHLYKPSDFLAAEEQRLRFLAETARAESVLGRLPRHLSATGGVLLGKNFEFDGVRIGIGMYGYLPSGVAGEISLRPAMKVYAYSQGSHRFSGGGMGYGRAVKAYADVSVYRLGYADGFLRCGMGEDLRGEAALCMDGCVAAGRRKYGEKKLVFSSADEVAKKRGTIACEVLCAVGRRARYEYE